MTYTKSMIILTYKEEAKERRQIEEQKGTLDLSLIIFIKTSEVKN